MPHFYRQRDKKGGEGDELSRREHFRLAKVTSVFFFNFITFTRQKFSTRKFLPKGYFLPFDFQVCFLTHTNNSI